ncbi:hypothetical protein ACTXJF_09320 [Psychrobacter alimentarius]|uniref:hypothetical protein n=1 Tax=Psychrobacter alimentarius TaxID=261164 RepID=UPI003FD3B116
MNTRKDSEFAKHISELQSPLDKPYSKKIDYDLFKSDDDTQYLNKQIHNVNPDCLTFLPDFFWYFYFCIGWVYFSTYMFLIVFFMLFIKNNDFITGSFFIWFVLLGVLLFATLCTPLVLLVYQLIRKQSYRTQYYFLKKEQKVAYYYRSSFKLRHPYELKIVNYKDLIPDLRIVRYNEAYKPLNLYVANPKTGDITHHLQIENFNVNAKVQWAFIRTYMESPADDLPIDNEICQAYPVDTSQSLFACSDIIFRKNGLLNNTHSGSDTAIVLTISSLYALGYLFQGNHYQCVKRAILHPDVKKLLTWDGKDNPYPIQPITPEAEKAFQGKNWQVNFRWIVAILINLSLFAWAVVAYNS